MPCPFPDCDWLIPGDAVVKQAGRGLRVLVGARFWHSHNVGRFLEDFPEAVPGAVPVQDPGGVPVQDLSDAIIAALRPVSNEADRSEVRQKAAEGLVRLLVAIIRKGSSSAAVRAAEMLLARVSDQLMTPAPGPGETCRVCGRPPKQPIDLPVRTTECLIAINGLPDLFPTAQPLEQDDYLHGMDLWDAFDVARRQLMLFMDDHGLTLPGTEPLLAEYRAQPAVRGKTDD